MSEARLWQKLRDAVKGNDMHMTRHECCITRGTPDVSFCAQGRNGWIELKYIPKAPARGSTAPLKGRITNDQARFLEGRPNTWVLVEVGGKGFWLFEAGRDVEHLESWAWEKWQTEWFIPGFVIIKSAKIKDIVGYLVKGNLMNG